MFLSETVSHGLGQTVNLELLPSHRTTSFLFIVIVAKPRFVLKSKLRCVENGTGRKAGGLQVLAEDLLGEQTVNRRREEAIALLNIQAGKQARKRLTAGRKSRAR